MTETNAPADSDAAWEQWWDVQYGLCHELDKLMDAAAGDRSDQFAAALVASLIEHLGERMRMYLKLPGSDVREEEGGTHA